MLTASIDQGNDTQSAEQSSMENEQRKVEMVPSSPLDYCLEPSVNTPAIRFEEQKKALPKKNSKLLKNSIYSRVESRMASEYWDDFVENKRTVSKIDTLDDMAECTMPLLLGGFTRTSTVRARCFQMAMSSKWKAFFVSVNLANCIYLAAVPELYQTTFNSEGNATASRRLMPPPATPSRNLLAVVSQPTPFADVFEAFCVLVLAFEALMWSIAVGFVGSDRAYLRRSYFNQLDFTVLLLTISEYFLIFAQGSSSFSLRAFRLLRLVQPLLSLESFRDVNQFLTTLSKGAAQLISITAVLFLFLLSFSVIGRLQCHCILLFFFCLVPAVRARNWRGSLP